MSFSLPGVSGSGAFDAQPRTGNVLMSTIFFFLQIKGLFLCISRFKETLFDTCTLHMYECDFIRAQNDVKLASIQIFAFFAVIVRVVVLEGIVSAA